MSWRNTIFLPFCWILDDDDSFPLGPTLLLPATPTIYVLQVSCIILKTRKLIIRIFVLNEVFEGNIENIHKIDEVILEVKLHPVGNTLLIIKCGTLNIIENGEKKTCSGFSSFCITLPVTNDGNSIVHKSWLEVLHKYKGFLILLLY